MDNNNFSHPQNNWGNSHFSPVVSMPSSNLLSVRGNRQIEPMGRAWQSLSSVAINAQDFLTIAISSSQPVIPKLTFVNPLFTGNTGYTADEFFSKNPSLMQITTTIRQGFDQENPTVVNRFKDVSENKQLPCGASLNLSQKEGELSCRWQCDPSKNTEMVKNQRPILDADKKQRRREEARLLIYKSTHDGLTDLYNRSYFMRELDEVVERAKEDPEYQFVVLLLDVDRFKIINDSLGHQVGDRLLEGVGERLRECIPPWHTVARLGGDEFAILLDDLNNLNQISQTAQNIQSYLQQPIVLGEQEVFSTVSIGIAISNVSYGNGKEILRDADTALSQAKSKGKACHVIFNPTMHRQAWDRMQLENDLRHAIERQELQLHYQPIISLETLEVVGCEALIRWEHPKRGWVSPSQFIPIAEETGLIQPIGEWVLREACQTLHRWQLMFPDGQPAFMSVNLSTYQLTNPQLVNKVQSILEETGCDPYRLKLELTESTIAEYAEIVVPQMRELSQLGIKLCIDDFGTGYSSLSRLYHFPIHTLKIDRSFIEGIDESQDQLKIAYAIVNLAHTLGLEVIAEGVETPEQMAVLQAWGCQLCQGYLFSKAVDSQNMDKFLSQGRIMLSATETLREWQRFAQEIERLIKPLEKGCPGKVNPNIHIA
ncbi:MAG: bifunctional diguanylate cyclase/phosphodiesterase [Arthrospira sp. PLM2.Bin9]|nr:MAG: bifunctional diguanylate cyclase/phosphodiesterase [Arthrospira sp. PLM2.Bin9]